MTEPRYAVRFKRSVVRDLPRLDAPAQRRVRVAIHEHLPTDSRLGKRLSGVCEAAAARPLWSCRVGDFRVIQAFDDAEVWILVVG